MRDRLRRLFAVPAAAAAPAVEVPPEPPPFASWSGALAARAAMVGSLDLHLQAVVGETERAAMSIVEHFQALDRGVDALAGAVHQRGAEAEQAMARGRFALRAQDEALQALQQMRTRRAEAAAQDRAVSARVDAEARVAEHALDNVRRIVHQTRILAINARIESTRAGQVGAGFAVVANEVKALACATEASVEEARAHVRGSFSRVQAEIAARLRAHEASSAAEETTLGQLAKQVGTLARSVEELQRLQAALLVDVAHRAQELGGPVRAGLGCVQFQDVARQKIEQSVRILHALEGQVGALGAAIAAGTPAEPPVELDVGGLVNSYVMDSQRREHATAAGNDAVHAAAPAIELF